MAIASPPNYCKSPQLLAKVAKVSNRIIMQVAIANNREGPTGMSFAKTLDV